MHLNGPIALDEETQIHAIAFAYDPELPPVETPNGRVEFLQIVGITTDELSAIKSWRTAAFLDLIHKGWYRSTQVYKKIRRGDE